MSPLALNAIAISEPACSSVTSRSIDELRIDQKPRAFVGDHDLVAPRQHAAERAVHLGRQPLAVANSRLRPIGARLDARPPGGVGRVAFERAAAFP